MCYLKQILLGGINPHEIESAGFGILLDKWFKQVINYQIIVSLFSVSLRIDHSANVY